MIVENLFDVKKYKNELAALIELYNARPSLENHQKRILWVDDNPSNNIKVIKYGFEHGVIFDLALSTSQAIGLLKKNKYDIIITDTLRDGKSDAGYSLIIEINKLITNLPYIVVYTTTDTIERYGERFMKIGVNVLTDKCEVLRNLIIEGIPK